MKNRPLSLLIVVLLGVTVAYANHFHNSFHFDDTHTIIQNAYIRNVQNIPSFFTDGTRFSVLPMNRTYRPVVSATIAIDYWLSVHLPIKNNGQFWFHLSTFLWFLLQLVAMYAFFTVILNIARRSSLNSYTALFATAWYGLHPANAETVNYIIQRGDVYSTAGVVTGLALFACLPKWRTSGVYLVPVALALLSKPPALVFPVLLSIYIFYFEEDANPKDLLGILRKTWPAWVVTVAMAWLQAALTPKSYTPLMSSKTDYLHSQPYVWLRYFENFLLPVHLSADTDLIAFHSINNDVLLGFLFAAALLVLAVLTARSSLLRPISYGVIWFVVTLLPTSLYPLSEVENDHRMYFAFVGLVLAASWALTLGLESFVQSRSEGFRKQVHLQASLWTAASIVLCSYAYGTHVRNKVWRTEKTLWFDVVQKSPRNPRGLMTYGMTLSDEGKYDEALPYLTRAEAYNVRYPALQVNLGVVYMGLRQMENAGRRFQLALAVAPNDDRAHFNYAGWLNNQGHAQEALEELQTAYRLNPPRTETRDSLIELYTASGNLLAARQVAEETVHQFPGEPAATEWLAHPPVQDEAYWTRWSTLRHHVHHEAAALDAARHALQANPDSADAYHCMSAAYSGMEMWDLALRSESRALALKPNFEAAENNLDWIHREMQLKDGAAPALVADDLLRDSARFTKAQQFEEGIAAARTALRLRPDDPGAYDSLADAYVGSHRWNEAIEAAHTALRLKPKDETAQQDLAWALLSNQVQKQGRP